MPNVRSTYRYGSSSTAYPVTAVKIVPGGMGGGAGNLLLVSFQLIFPEPSFVLNVAPFML